MARTPEVEEKHDAAARLDDLLADQGKTSGILVSPKVFYQPGRQYCELDANFRDFGMFSW